MTSLEFFPLTDCCSKRQHDEDSGNGLWVTNELDDACPKYGDKQLSSDKPAKNREQAIRAVQTSVNTYTRGLYLKKFKALDIVSFYTAAVRCDCY